MHNPAGLVDPFHSTESTVTSTCTLGTVTLGGTVVCGL